MSPYSWLYSWPLLDANNSKNRREISQMPLHRLACEMHRIILYKIRAYSQFVDDATAITVRQIGGVGHARKDLIHPADPGCHMIIE